MVALLVLASCSDDSNSSDAAAPDAVEDASMDGERTARPGRATWSTGYFQAAIYAQLLEELGFRVTAPSDHEYDPAVAYLAMAEGAYDFWANGWYSQHLTHHRVELDDGSTVGDHVEILGNEIPDGGLEGLVITKSTADEHGIQSLAQINDDPELAALFDLDGDGLAEIRGCPVDWTCDDIIDETIQLNGWTNLEQVRAGYDGLVADSIERVTNGQPVIQYTWSPSGHLVDLDPGGTVYWLSLGGPESVLDGSTPSGIDFSDAPAAPLGSDCTADPCWLGWQVADIQVTAARTFLEANPDAAELLRRVQMTVDDVAHQNQRYANGENTEADIERHADEWVAEHREQADAWLDAARGARDG